MRAAHAQAETAEVPMVTIADPSSKRRVTFAVLAVATVAIVGATAATLGVLSTRSTPVRTAAVSPGLVSDGSDVEVAAAPSGSTEEVLAAKLHDELAASLPRIQAATDAGMREGSGLFVTQTGHIVTSAGLVADAEYVLAWTNDGRRWQASVVAVDRLSDIAVVHIDSDEWPAVTIGTERSLRPGQYALAIDHAADSMSVGQIESLTDLVSIDPGSTATRIGIDQATALPGAAIVDDAGFVVGMATSDPGSMATPAHMIERVALELIVSGEADHAWLGIVVGESVRTACTARSRPAGEP